MLKSLNKHLPFAPLYIFALKHVELIIFESKCNIFRSSGNMFSLTLYFTAVIKNKGKLSSDIRMTLLIDYNDVFNQVTHVTFELAKAINRIQ